MHQRIDPEIGGYISASVEEARVATRDAFFAHPVADVWSSPVYARSRLRPGHHIEGPAIVEQYDSTVVVTPGQYGEMDVYGNLVLRTVEGYR